MKSRKDHRQSFRLTRNGFSVRGDGRLFLAKVGEEQPAIAPHAEAVAGEPKRLQMGVPAISKFSRPTVQPLRFRCGRVEEIPPGTTGVVD